MWSGGKDSFLSYVLQNEGETDKPVFVTMLDAFGHRQNYDVNFSFADIKCLIDHSRYFEADHVFVFSKHSCTVPKYEDISTYLRSRFEVTNFTFGDIFPSFDEWRESKLAGARCNGCQVRAILPQNIKTQPVFPLEGRSIEEILLLLQSKDIRAKVFGVGKEAITSLLGEIVSPEVMKEQLIYGSKDIDPLGENGDFQTLVIGYGEKEFRSSETLRLHKHWLNFRQCNISDELIEGEILETDVFSDMMVLTIRR